MAKDKGQNFLENTALHIGKGSIPIEGDISKESLEYKRIVKERTLANTTRFEQEADERGADYESPETEEDPHDRWDAESILSTYTNTDNHPSLIKFVPKVKTNKDKMIMLHKQFKVPIGGLDGLIPIAEEIEIKKK